MSGTLLICPECGNRDLRSVRWGYADLPRHRTPAVDTVIFGGTQRPECAPDSACLHCHPEWADIHQLAIEEERCQQKIEEFVAGAEFELALQWKERRENVQESLRGRLKVLFAQHNA